VAVKAITLQGNEVHRFDLAPFEVLTLDLTPRR
jgi:hypothetical protein